jgi:hypothetical protein
MARHKFLVLSNPRAGREDEFNAWYSNHHMIEALQLPGFVSAQRFRIDPAQSRGASHGYLAVYELETDDPAKTLAGMWAAVSGDHFTPGDSIDPHSIVTLACVAITDEVRK